MKPISRTISFVALAILAITLTACGTPSAQVAALKAQTPAQIAAQVCPPLQIAVGSFQALAGLPATAQADLQKADKVITDVCAVGASVTVVNINSISTDVVPALLAAVQSSGMTPAQQNKATLGINAVQIILTAVTAEQNAAASAPAVVAPVPASSPASAPATL